MIVLATLACLLPSANLAAAEPEPPRRAAAQPWPEELGNHRALVRVTQAGPAVRARLVWRRRDAHPEAMGIVVHSPGGQTVANRQPAAVDAHACDLVFEPVDGPGDYAVYTMPYQPGHSSVQHVTAYAPYEATADAAWVAASGLGDGSWSRLAEAAVIAFEGRRPYDVFSPMELSASHDEVAALLVAHPRLDYMLFAEPRERPIVMADRVPVGWARTGPVQALAVTARPGEFLAFQIGLFAARESIDGLDIGFSPLRQGGRAAVPASAFRCTNLGGTDWMGRRIDRHVSVPEGHVQALWMGVQLPPDLSPGGYTTELVVRPKGLPESRVSLRIEVAGEPLVDAGDSELWRMARLRWLDSTLAVDDEVTAPLTPIRVDGNRISCLGREVKLGPSGLPRRLLSYFADTVDALNTEGRDLLAAPVRLVVEVGGQPMAWDAGQLRVEATAPGAATVESSSRSRSLKLAVSAKSEFDGFTDYRLALTADREVAVDDIRLEIPMRAEVARYLMGMGVKGGLRTQPLDWKWSPERHQDSVWLGDVNAGLQLKLKGENYSRPLVNIYYAKKPLNMPPSWSNEGRGGCTVTEEPGIVLIRAYSGPRTIRAGETLHFDFSLLLTPVKLLDKAHFGQRYFHAHVAPAEAKAGGANIINIHHANPINPYINYPFHTVDGLKSYIDGAHDDGMKVKIYYTVRELSNFVTELHALRSLGTEVFADGPGQGDPWLCEHLISNYIPAWRQPLPNGEVDAAIITSGMSRWHNYYVEGLQWLVRNVGIDGLYIDDVAYDREVMKRVRKVLDRNRPGCLIDLHSWNHFNDWARFANCANLYMENFPYIDSLWFGEGFDYNAPPDFWLIEMAGIPYGLYSEMLQDGGNRWRGMVYGMTNRKPWSGGDPAPVWRLWDEFGIDEARMYGYWSASCPVRTDRDDVLATVYVRPGRALVAVASWAPEPATIGLTIDWQALGLDPANARLRAPALPDFQPEATFAPADTIPFEPGKGWLLLIEPKA